MDLVDYLAILRKHWIGVALIVLLCTAGAFGYSAIQPKVYAASATGFVGTGATQDAALGSMNDQLARSRATSYVDIAKGRATAQTVISQLGLSESPSQLVGRISVEHPLDTVLLKITARADTPHDAQKLADTWVTALAQEVQEIESPNKARVADGTPRIVPVEAAELPTRPVEPKIERNTLLGLIVGAGLGFAYAIARRTLDRRISSPTDIEQQFKIAVVGTIPVSSQVQSTGPGALAADPALGEAFRKLRTNLMYMDVDNPPRLLSVTSPQPGDGKSTVASSLAVALAQTEQNVILVDADLRRPTIADRFGVEGSVGLVNVLIGQMDVQDALQKPRGFGGLSILASGPLPPNPSEILGSNAMRTLLKQLAEHAYVVVDAPPLLPVTDAAILARVTEGALVVVSTGKTLDIELEASLEHLETVNARALGVILNRRKRRGGSGYGYGYGTEYYATKAVKQKPTKAKAQPAGRRRA